MQWKVLSEIMIYETNEEHMIYISGIRWVFCGREEDSIESGWRTVLPARRIQGINSIRANRFHEDQIER